MNMRNENRRNDFIEVIAPGPLTSVQDQGRHGWRHLGIARSGALDPELAALANHLVGNRDDAAVLELSLHGPSLHLPRPSRIALLGASVDARFEGLPLPMARPIELPAGTLRLGGLRNGVRAWLAIAGGFDIEPVLGSRSTDLRGGFGGHQGRALQAGDRLPLGASPSLRIDSPRIAPWWVDPDFDEDPDLPIRYLPSANAAQADSAAALARQPWTVATASNRQGLRLDGAPLPAVGGSGLSEPVAPGTIQLPADGHPIVLLADAQTVGGYARLGHVIAADLPRLAQAPPHARLRFQACDAPAAIAALRHRRERMVRLRLAVSARLQGMR
ncbi:biotin-dependent carboxyltransferase family protein [Lysobacter sp. CA196]|uniref:5-oxoprolinase subunit C family protein n=1 Tax=Lysobacter sp. CA196 TaxID=3455606 RepID=UPI003F8D2621